MSSIVSGNIANWASEPSVDSCIMHEKSLLVLDTHMHLHSLVLNVVLTELQLSGSNHM